MAEKEKIPVGISGCLLGQEVRYNGGHKHDAYINGTLSEYFAFASFCPEVGIGMGVPREPIRLVETGQGIRVVGTRNAGLDVTDDLKGYFFEQAERIAGLSGFILKRASPSCGMERVKVFNHKGMPHATGTGIFAAELMRHFPLLPVEEEGRLGDPRLRENFIQRVLIYDYWRHLRETGFSVAALTTFHSRIKLTLMSHNQQSMRRLGKLAASARANNLQQVADDYIAEAMKTLKIIASKKNHVNVLQHIQGYLKKELESDDKAELTEVIEQYRKGDVPLVVPLTLLRHHFRRAPSEYIAESWYFDPYPQALKLRNLL